MRYLGMDLGTRTLGLSLSDRTNVISSPLKTIRFLEDHPEDTFLELSTIIREKDITDFVLGLPKNMNNSLGFAAERTMNFKEKLDSFFGLPIHLVDERLSSVEAENLLINSDIRRIKRKKVVDNVAAAIILDTYLKERRILNERNSQEK